MMLHNLFTEMSFAIVVAKCHTHECYLSTITSLLSFSQRSKVECAHPLNFFI